MSAPRELCPIPSTLLSPVIAWVRSIPFEAWPQQRTDRVLPAMVNDLSWMKFGEQTDKLVASIPALGTTYQRMLSTVLPGNSIPEHRDRQIHEWIGRVHIPLVTNPDALFIVEGVAHHLQVGFAYLVDTTALHAVTNAGPTARTHLMFDLQGPASLCEP